MAIKQYSLAKDGAKQLAPAFKVREFRCRDGSDAIMIDQTLVVLLQAIREHFGKAVTITSGYRTVSAGTVARTAVLLLALTNQILSAMGKPILPIESSTVEQLVTAGITSVAALVSWWKNNSFTQAALAADEVYEQKKNSVH